MLGHPHTLDDIDPMEDHAMVPWNKLEKTFKLNKLYEYVDRCATEHSLNAETVTALRSALKEKLTRKQLQKAKDVGYDKVAGCITVISILQFSGGAFSFKNLDAVSPMHSLAPKNKTVRRAI